MPPPPPTTPLARPQEKDRAGSERHPKPCTSALETLFTELDSTSRALLLSQGGDAASCAFTAVPTSADTRVPDDEFRVMLLRRLRLPLPLAPKRCACGGLLDVYGDHRSACAQVGVLARRAGPLERAAARICKEPGARVASHVALRDLNLDVPASDGRRFEVVANGLPLWQGAQVAVDATVVSPVRRDGQPRPRADQQPGLALAQAVDRKGRTYPELRQVKPAAAGWSSSVLRSEDASAGPRSPSCDCSPSLLELPIEGPSDPTDGLEVLVRELLHGGPPATSAQ